MEGIRTPAPHDNYYRSKTIHSFIKGNCQLKAAVKSTVQMLFHLTVEIFLLRANSLIDYIKLETYIGLKFVDIT